VRELLAAVKERPDDDAPRLEYAGAVGGARGRLIEVQCALARAGRRDPRRAAWRDEEARLLEEHAAEWGAATLDALGARATRFRRGFPEHVELDAAAFLENGMGFVGSLVRSVRLVGVGGRLEEILESPFVVLVRELDLSAAGLHNLDVERIAAAERLRGLRTLDLGGNDIDDRGVERLAASPHLALAGLGLAGDVVSDEGVRALPGSPALGALRELDLARVPFGDGFGILVREAGVVALAGLPLRRLVLAGNPIGDAGAAALGRGFEELRELELAGCGLGPSAAWSLAAAPPLAQLDLLDLSGNPLASAGARALREGPFLPRDLTLVVVDCGLEDEELDALRARFADVLS
jgi:hypothetical protein